VRNRRRGKGLQINDVYCASPIVCGLRRREAIIARSIFVRTLASCGMKKGMTFLEHIFKKVPYSSNRFGL
jgi:hypothetical protein